MLSKKKRVTKEIFQLILKKGIVVSGSFFLFKYIPFERPSYSFVVSKKMVKTAIKRNFLRRRGYNILKQNNLKPIAGVFFYKKEAINVENIRLKKDIENILEKCKVF
ncbi:MAG: ribonuclease P protein component [Candidatus Paceibacterota bacterium]